MAKIVELIYTEDRRGLGVPDNPVRLVPQLWTKDGKLLAEWDHYSGEMIVRPHISELGY